MTMLLCLALFISSCGMKRESRAIEKEDSEQEFLIKGKEIVDLSQAELLKNVATAMGADGPAHAVDFCNVHALSIKDSLSRLYHCEIRRIAIKYRNPEDKPRPGTEQDVLDSYLDGAQKEESLQAVVYQFEDRTEYYHPIFITSGACLLCHGIPGKEISDQTMTMISTHYPGDLATGYQMNDFRGAWKITFMTD